MKYVRRMILPLVLISCFLLNITEVSAAPSKEQKTEALTGWPKGVPITSEGGILIEEDSKAVLYGKNIHRRLYPASTTKIMTALITLEHCSLDETVTFSEKAVYDIEPGSSIIGGVNAGDKMSLKNCMYGLLLSSGNEAAYALAEHVGGTMPKFVEMMNQKVKELGLKDTHFTNPHGLHNKRHYTSPYDLAMIMREAWKNPDFRKISGTVKYTIPADKYCKKARILYNHNKLLPSRAYACEGVEGGKTGYTDEAGSTLVVAAKRNGMTCFSVVMKTKRPNQFLDAAALLDYGFSSFHKVSISSSESQKRLESLLPGLRKQDAACIIDEEAYIVLPKGRTIADADVEVKDGRSLVYQFDGHAVGTARVQIVLPEESSEKKAYKKAAQASPQTENRGMKAATFARRMTSIALLVGLFAMMAAIYHFTERKRAAK